MNRSLKLIAASVMLAATGSAMAGGFMLSEQSVTSVGRVHAGAGIMGDDASAVWYNAAGMTLLPGTRFQFGGVFVALDLPVTTANGAYTDNGADKAVPIPHMFFTHQLNDSWWFGLGLTVPFGLATEYDRKSPLAGFGMNSELQVFDLNPNVAWKINEKFSVGLGGSVQYATARFETATETGYARLNADSWAFGFNVSAMWSPTETVRFGLAYRSAVKHTAEGRLRMGVNPGRDGYIAEFNDTSVDLDAPTNASLTAAWEVTPQLTLSGLVRWTDWSSFQSLDIKSDTLTAAMGVPMLQVVNNWDDSWLVSVGADYKVNDAWTVRGGVGYEWSPVNDDHRMAVIPDTDRVWLALGASWNVTEAVQADFGLTYLLGVGNKELRHNGVKVAEFDDLTGWIIGAQFAYKF